MGKKIYNFIKNEKEYVPKIAKEIIDTFQREANSENVEYSFTIDGETKKIAEKDSNTYFVFDTVEDTLLDEFKKILFDDDLADIEENSHEEKVLMEDVRQFLFKICETITKQYKEELKNVIRRVVLGNKYDKTRVPLSEMQVVSIDVADYSSVPDSHKYILRIGKIVNTEIDTDEIISFVQNRQEKTGMDIDSIFSIEKQAGNPLFKNVLSIEPSRKFLNEISLFLFVDYTFVLTEEENKLQSENEKV